MSHAPPVPEANQSPFPRHDAPIAHSELPPVAEASPTATSAATAKVADTAAAARDKVTELQTRAVTAAKARPFAAAALIGTVALAVLGSLRRKRA